MKKIVLLAVLGAVSASAETNITVLGADNTRVVGHPLTYGGAASGNIADSIVTAGGYMLNTGNVGLSAGLDIGRTNVSVLGGADTQLKNHPASLGAMVSERIAGPLSVSAFGINNGTVGLGAGLSF